MDFIMNIPQDLFNLIIEGFQNSEGIEKLFNKTYSFVDQRIDSVHVASKLQRYEPIIPQSLE